MLLSKNYVCVDETKRNITQSTWQKKTKNPTMRWIFQIMEGAEIAMFYVPKTKKIMRELITNLNELRKKINMLFGIFVGEMYELIPKKCSESY